LAVAQTVVVGIDHCQTEYHATHNYNFQEHNPLLKPGVRHPVALAADVAVGSLFSAWLAHQMRFSKHMILRKTWWLPQTMEIGAGIWGIASSKVRN
jgi:hypothetical protein